MTVSPADSVQRTFHQVSLLISAFVYPAWSLLILFAFPEEVDSPVGRIFVSVFLVACALVIRKQKERRSIDFIAMAGYAVMTLHLLVLLSKSHLSPFYSTGTIVYLSCIALVFPGLMTQMAFVAFFNGVLAFLSFTLGSTNPAALLLFASCSSIGAAMVVVRFQQERLSKQLEQKRMELEKRGLHEKLLEQKVQLASHLSDKLNSTVLVLQNVTEGVAKMVEQALSDEAFQKRQSEKLKRHLETQKSAVESLAHVSGELEKMRESSTLEATEAIKRFRDAQKEQD